MHPYSYFPRPNAVCTRVRLKLVQLGRGGAHVENRQPRRPRGTDTTRRAPAIDTPPGDTLAVSLRSRGASRRAGAAFRSDYRQMFLFDVWSISGQPRGDILLRMNYESTVTTLRDKTPLAALELKISTVASLCTRPGNGESDGAGTPSTRQCVGWRLLFDRGPALHIIRQTCHPCRPRPSPCEANRGSSLPQTLRARLRPARHLPRMAARRRMRH